MKSLIYFLLLTIALTYFQGCGFISKKYTKSETSEFSVNTVSKRKLKLENINGNITVSRSSDSTSLKIKAYKEIKVKKKYLNTPFDEIIIDVDSNSQDIIIKTVISNKGSDGFFNIGRSQNVDYNIYVPENLDIEIENVNGEIIAGEINNDLSIENVNGNAEINNFQGKLNCEITNGSLSGEIDSTRGVNINIINGSISLKLNNFLSANLNVQTVNGKITDEELTLKDVVRDKKHLRAKIGNADTDTEIKIETINGKIKLFGNKEI